MNRGEGTINDRSRVRARFLRLGYCTNGLLCSKTPQSVAKRETLAGVWGAVRLGAGFGGLVSNSPC